MAADLPQQVGRQSARVEEVEHRRRAVVRGGIEGGPAPAPGPGGVRHPAGLLGVRARVELGEPPRVDGPQLEPGRHPQERVSLAQLAVLVAAAGHERRRQAGGLQVEGDGVEVVVSVDDHGRAVARARLGDGPESRDDLGGGEEHRGHQRAGRAAIHAIGQTVGERRDRGRRDLDYLEAFLRQPVELAPRAVELAVCGHDPRAGAQVQRGQQPDHQLVGARGEGDVAVRIAQKPPVARAHAVGDDGNPVPLVIHVLGGIQPGAPLTLEGHVRPRLMRVSGEQEALRDPEASVVGGERVRRAVQVFGADVGARRAGRPDGRRVRSGRDAHRRDRIAQRSGKAGRNNVVRRYSAPEDPPVPGFAPMVRSTILTWR